MFNRVKPYKPLAVRRTVYDRAMREAGRAWRAGKPATARDVLEEAGLGALWPTYQRTARTWTKEQGRLAAQGDRRAAALLSERVTGRARQAPRT